MKRKTLPKCPYCGARMFPQASTDGWISYICSNAECKAVSPREKTFGKALDKAEKRAEVTLKWINRDKYEPAQNGEYLCEYAYVKSPDEEPVLRYYGVRGFDVAERRFKYEGESFLHQTVKVLRWADFTKDNAETVRTATQKTDAEVQTV